MKKLFFLSLLFLLAQCAELSAAKRYWIGASSSWKSKANWSTTSGGAGGASVPGAIDTAYFNAAGNVSCTLDSLVNIRRLEVAAGYTATITQSTYTIAIGNGGATLSGGTFSGGSAGITAGSLFVISGNAFTSTSGLFATNSGFNLSSGSFNHNNGKMKFAATSTITGTVPLVFHQVEFAPVAASTYLIAGTVTISDTFLVSGTVGVTFSGTYNIKGDMIITNTSNGGGGGGTFLINGTGTQTITGGVTGLANRLPNVTIVKSSSTLALANTVAIAGNWTYTSGVISAGSSTVHFITTKTISGTHTLNDVIFSANAVYTVSNTLTVTGTLLYGGGTTGSIRVNTGTINAQGNVNLKTQVTGGGGTGTVVINGTGNQTITGTATPGYSALPNVTINKSSGTLTLDSTITVAGNWTYTAGTLSSATGTVCFWDTKTISGSHTLTNISFNNSAASTFTVASGTTLTVSGDFGLNGNNNAIFNTGDIHVYGNVNITNAASGGGGTTTVTLKGSSNQTITGSGTAGQGRLPNVVIDKSSGVLTLASVISVAGHWVYTDIGSGSIIPGTSTVAFYGTKNLDGQQSGSAACMPFYNVTINGDTRTLTGNLDCNNNFTIASGATCVAGSNKIFVGGDWNSAGTWTYGTGTVVFDGNGYNRILGAAGTVNFANVELSRNTSPGSVAKNLRLQNPVLINTSMTLNKGRVYSTATNYLAFADNATCTVTNDDSAYVHGPVRKTGDDAFAFPLGDTTLHDSVAFHPLGMTAPANASDVFWATYFAAAQTQGATVVDSLLNLSTCEHWKFERTTGSSVVQVTLSWNRNSCNTSVYGDLRVANWDGTQWNDLGASAITITGNRGDIKGSSSPSYVSNSAYLSTATARNNFPYAVLTKKLDGGYYQAINGRLFFRFDEEYYDTGDLRFTIYNDKHQLVTSSGMMPATVRPQVVYGDNRYKLNTVGCDITPSGALANGFYTLEVVNDKNEKWYLRFEQNSNIILSNCPPPTSTE